jgi:hypothetical protein
VTSWFLGGPAYNSKLDARHAACLAQACIEIVSRGDSLAGVEYVHDSVLPHGRGRWLQLAIESGADLGVTMDADTWAKDTHHAQGGRRMIRAFDRMMKIGGRVLAGALVAQRNGKVNAWRAEGERLREEGAHAFVFDEGARHVQVRAWSDVWAIGLACAVFDLRWYREHVKNAYTTFAMLPTGVGDGFVGEDVWHCEAIRKLGGGIAALELETTHGGW